MISLKDYFEDIENRISVDTEEKLLDEWRNFLDGGFQGDYFSPSRLTVSQSNVEWPNININDAFDDVELMILSQLRLVNYSLSGGGAILSVRPNYSIAIIPSLFGARLFMMDKQHNCLPTSIPFKNGTDDIKRLLEKGIPDTHGGLMKKVFEFADRYMEIAKQYPKIMKYVDVYHPDLQGPIAVCELLWGSSIFYTVYDDEQLLHDMSALVCDTYEKVIDKWFEIFPFKKYNSHWGMLHKGALMLRTDSSMNFSSEHYSEFIAPYEERLLNKYGGGMHFCGKGDHYIKRLCDINNLSAIAMSQPEYNNMETIYNNTIDKNIVLLGLNRDCVQQALSMKRDLKNRVHCF